jgi:hypothetical protein
MHQANDPKLLTMACSEKKKPSSTLLIWHLDVFRHARCNIRTAHLLCHRDANAGMCSILDKVSTYENGPIPMITLIRLQTVQWYRPLDLPQLSFWVNDNPCYTFPTLYCDIFVDSFFLVSSTRHISRPETISLLTYPHKKWTSVIRQLVASWWQWSRLIF